MIVSSALVEDTSPSAFDTKIIAGPETARLGIAHSTLLLSSTVALTLSAPTTQLVTLRKLEPCTVTAAPTRFVTLCGNTPLTDRSSKYKNASSVAEVAPALPFMTFTGTSPTLCAGDVQIRRAEDTQVAVTSTPSDPKTHRPLPFSKPAPKTLTLIPPPMDPELGFIPVSPGRCTYRYFIPLHEHPCPAAENPARQTENAISPASRPAALLQVNSVFETTSASTARPPKTHRRSFPENPDPDTVTMSPPSCAPMQGSSRDTERGISNK